MAATSCCAASPTHSGLIDGKLALASPAPLVESREVHERKPHRPFDLVDILASEEHRGAMSIDANDGLAKFMRRGVGQESEDVALVEAGLVHRFVSSDRDKNLPLASSH